MNRTLAGSLVLLLSWGCASPKRGSQSLDQACMEECEQGCPGRGGSAGAGDRYFICLEKCETKCS